MLLLCRSVLLPITGRPSKGVYGRCFGRCSAEAPPTPREQRGRRYVLVAYAWGRLPCPLLVALFHLISRFFVYVATFWRVV